MQGTDPAPIAWVTGAAGFIAPHVMRRLSRGGWRVVGLDRAPAIDVADKVVGEIAAATLDAAARLAGVPSLVFHAAGTGTVEDSTRDPAASRRDNVSTTEVVLDWLRLKAPKATFILCSSAAVYGNAGDGPLPEDIVPTPISVYGRDKAAAEHAALSAAQEGRRVAILRLFSVYGPGLRKQLPWELGRKLAGPAPVELFGTGAETRDFFEVSDVAELVAFLARLPFASPLIVNGGTGTATRIADFVAAFAAAAGSAAALSFNGAARADDPVHLYADRSRLDALGFTPRAGSLQAGVRAYVAWLKTLRE